MEQPTSTRWYGRHFLAVVCSTGFLTIVPMTLHGGLIVWSGDLGGPLNLVIIPLMSAIIGFGISLVVFMPASSLAESSSFHRWRHIVGGLLAALTAVVVLAWIFIGTVKPQNYVFLVGSVSFYFVGGFFVYLSCLAVCRRIWPPSPSESPGTTRIG